MHAPRMLTRGWLAVVVAAHLFISLLHGRAHADAHVALSTSGSLFVLVVILAGPLLGLALTARWPRIGAVIVATTMGGAFAFGVVNHFLLASADHVMAVAASSRALFGSTAVLLAMTEALGSWLAFKVLLERQVAL